MKPIARTIPALLAAAGLLLLLPCRETTAQQRQPRLAFDSATLDIVLQDYSEATGRTLLMAPKLPTVSITLRSQGALTQEEYVEAIQSVLAMHGVVLIPEGEKFVRVVPGKSAREEPMPIREDDTRDELGDTSRLVSQLIALKHIEFSEADRAIKPLLHSARGTVNHFERINSILVTDTEANVRRMLQVLRHLDQPVEIREEPNIVSIRFAKASEIKSKLEEIIAESQREQKKTVTVPRPSPTGPPRVVAQPQPRTKPVPGVIRAPRPARPEPEPTPETVQEIIELAERGIIRGSVQIVADDRTNILIIITRPENMAFFRKIVDVLDIETAPDFVTKVIRLEHADAETVAGTLNTLIGQGGKDQSGAPVRGDGVPDDRVAALRDYAARMQKSAAGEPTVSKIGELSADNITILSDKRTNSLLIMASKSDLAAIEDIIGSMDIQLSQVLIEAVIMDVQLDDTLQTGMDWVQQAMVRYRNTATGLQPDHAFAGGGGGGTFKPRDVTALTDTGAIAPGSGLTYYITHFGLNIDAVLGMSASDGRTRIISSPVVVTHDNTEAKIESAMERYFYKGKKWIGTATEGRYEDDVEMRRVGLHLSVTPRINQKRFVVMDINQRIEDIVGTQAIGDTQWPTVQSREMSASIAVQDRETIVLGGLIREKEERTRRGIPFLYRLPLVGWMFGHRGQDRSRSEIIVFITPYVMDTEADIAGESRRRQRATHTQPLWQKSWSDSALAHPDGQPKPGAPANATPASEPPPAAPSGTQVIFTPELLEYIRQQEARYEPAARALEREGTAFPANDE